MKRILIALVLLICVIALYFFAGSKIRKYTDTNTEKINKICSRLEKDNRKQISKEISKIKNDKMIYPFIYKVYLTDFHRELENAEYYIKKNDMEEAEISLMRCIGYLDTFKDEYLFSKEKLF